MIKLSNGTLIERVQHGSGYIKAIVQPNDREMTDSEWSEYSALVVTYNKMHHEYASLMKYCAMRESGKYYIPEDMPSLETMQKRMAEIEKWFEAVEVL